jgi:hypothetical protein
MKFTLFNLNLIFLLCSQWAHAQQQWRFIKETEGVKVYYRESGTNNIKEVKMVTTFDAKLSVIVECLKDVDSYPKWVYKANYSKTIIKYSEEDVIYYNYFDFPWPLQDRDVAIQSHISQDPTTRVVTSVSVSNWSKEPLQKDVVRIQEFDSKWIFTPQTDGKVHGEYTFKSNPGGAIPASFVNLGLSEGPLRTLKGFKQLLRTDKYKNIKSVIKD